MKTYRACAAAMLLGIAALWSGGASAQNQAPRPAAAAPSAAPSPFTLSRPTGRFGRTLSTLRPGGVADFDGRRVDVLAEGIMVDPDQWVRCIDVRAGKVIVRLADKPPVLDQLENADFR